jgi:hypothetical protein
MNSDGSLLSRMAMLFAARAGMYCLSALVAGIFGVVCLTAVSLSLYPLYRAAPPGHWDPLMAWRSLTAIGKLGAVFGLLFALWTPVLLAARGVCRITNEQISGRPLSAAQLLADMARFLPSALVYAPVMGLPSMMGSSMLFVPGMLIASCFALVVPTSASEPGGVFATLRHGVSLALKVYGRAVLITLASSILIVIVIVLRINGLDRFLSGSPATMFGMRIALTYIPSLLILVLANICFTLLYREARGAETQVSP